MLVPASAQACDLVISEHRSGKEVLRWPANQVPVQFDVSFTHSVLGTPVLDRYEFRWNRSQWQAVLVEEVHEGQGYGLPYGATESGQRYERTDDGWRLTLNRLVDPLVQLPLPSQNIRLAMDGQSVLLGDLSTRSLLIELHDCPQP
jgi:hypothetical protein